MLVNDVDPGLRGGIDQVPLYVLEEAATQAGAQVNGGILLRGRVAEGAEPAGRKAAAGLPVPFIEAYAFPGNYPESALAVLQKVRYPVGAVQVPGFYLLLGKRAGEAVFVSFAPVLPHLPAGVVPQAHVHGAASVFVEAGDAVIGPADPHFSVVVFQEGRDIVLGEGAHLLQGGAEDGKAVVAARPEVALPVLEEAEEFTGGYAGGGIGLMAEHLRVFRMEGIHDAQAVGARCPEAAFAVCQQPCMGNGYAAQGEGVKVLVSIQDGGVVYKGVEFSGAFGIASVIEHAFPAGERDVRIRFVCDILVVDQPAG